MQPARKQPLELSYSSLPDEKRRQREADADMRLSLEQIGWPTLSGFLRPGLSPRWILFFGYLIFLLIYLLIIH